MNMAHYGSWASSYDNQVLVTYYWRTIKHIDVVQLITQGREDRVIGGCYDCIVWR